jgi:4-amino-4-deoxy-L-arabinose transferase-like glycosyltransferase
MSLKDEIDRWTTRGRGPLLAALVALIAALPAIFSLPPTDRDESRFAEASAQMLESGDFTVIMFQDTPRFKKPVGIYWLQAASAELFHARRAIWAYRIPSILGAMLAAAACAWGAAAALRPWQATMAGAVLGSTAVLSTEAIIATTDAALCGSITLAMAALARLYLADKGGAPAGRWTRALFWLGLAASVLLKGPIGPMVVALSVLALCVWDRKAAWLKTLGWRWGLILFGIVVLPWALAITVATDGGFWGMAVGGDLAPKLFGGQEGHGAPPGYFLILAPVLLFPAGLIAPAAAVLAWRERAQPFVRFALCWLLPSWLVFELVPTKLPHYTLPTFGAIAWLIGAALAQPIGPRARFLGMLATGGVAIGIAVFAAVVAGLFGDAWSWVWVAVCGGFFLAAGAAGVIFLARKRAATAIGAACGLALVAHAAFIGGLFPTLAPIWLSQRVAGAVDAARGAQALPPGPVGVAGYGEPSLVFALGTATDLSDTPDAAADAIEQGRPAVVEQADDAGFHQTIAAAGANAKMLGEVKGLDYSTGAAQVLRVYAPASPAPHPAGSP